MTIRYRQIAADLRAAIAAGRYRAGTTLPTIAELATQYGVSRVTAHAAVTLIEAEGLVRAVPGTGTIVLDLRPVRVAYSRYAHTGRGAGGPWETACALQGIPGEMVLVGVQRDLADDDVAAALKLREESDVITRVRHAVIGNGHTRVVQIQTAWYPLALAAGTVLAGDTKIEGGVYTALTALGHPPADADETVTARAATADEAAVLSMRAGPVLEVERVTRGRAGRPLELLRVVADPAWTRLVYDGLPLPR